MEQRQAYLISATDAAPRLGRHPITLRRDLASGVVPGVKIGGRWFINSDVLEAVLAGEYTHTTAPEGSDVG